MFASSDTSHGSPQHIAIVMDGNGRWAARRLLPRLAGHKKGVESLERCVKACIERGVAVLTVFAFSSENWRRPQDEVQGLMDLLARTVLKQTERLHAQGVRLCFVGDLQGLERQLQQALQQAETTTRANLRLILNVCINYGGRWDIAQAAQRWARARAQSLPTSAQPASAAAANMPMVDAFAALPSEAELAQYLVLAHVPDPDLMIRTGGELRMSNFLLWQSAYSEWVFLDTLWPEFDERALDGAIAQFRARERRFGLISAQVGKTKSY